MRNKLGHLSVCKRNHNGQTDRQTDRQSNDLDTVAVFSNRMNVTKCLDD